MLLIIGSLVRLLVNVNFAFIIVGSVINAIGNVFILNAPSKFSTNWYKPENRALVTTICTYAVIASPTIGVAIPSLFVDANSNKDNVLYLLIFEASLVTGVMAITLIFFKGNPPSPPSYAAAQKKENFK